jgi:hypothetical protein
MPYVPVPKDLTKVKTKVAFGLTKRQLVCFSVAGAVGIPVYLLTRVALGGSGALLVMIGLMLPFFFLAMYEKDGLPAERLLINYVRARLWPGKRPYKTDNLYRYLEKKEGQRIGSQKQTAGRADKAPVRKHPHGKTKQG